MDYMDEFICSYIYMLSVFYCLDLNSLIDELKEMDEQ